MHETMTAVFPLAIADKVEEEFAAATSHIE
jgi:hypothetical protein